MPQEKKAPSAEQLNPGLAPSMDASPKNYSSGVGPILKALGVAALATIGLVGFAHAADVLPATEAPALRPSRKIAFAQRLEPFSDSTLAADCPKFTYRGFILLRDALDAGNLMYNTDGERPWNPAYVNGTHGLHQQATSNRPEVGCGRLTTTSTNRSSASRCPSRDR